MDSKYTLHTFSQNEHLVDSNDMDEQTAIDAVIALDKEWDTEEDLDIKSWEGEKRYLKDDLNRGAILVLVKDNELNEFVGYRKLIANPTWPPGIDLHAYSSFISPEHRGKGIFKPLLRRSHEAGAKAGYEFLHTNPVDDVAPILVAEGYRANSDELPMEHPHRTLSKIDLRPFREGNHPGENGLPPQARK